MGSRKDMFRFEDEQLAAAVALLEEDTCCKCGEPCGPDQVFCSLCQLQLLSGKVCLAHTA